MPPRPTSPSPPRDDAGRLTAHVACRGCGYDLHMLHVDNDCPECGESVWASARGDLLRFAPPKWVRTLAQGAATVGYAVLVGFFGGLVLGCVGWLGMVGLMLYTAQQAGGGGPAQPGPMSAWPVVVFPIAFALFGLAVFFAVLWGLWMLTTPEPHREVTGRAKSGQVVRVCAGLGVLLSVLAGPAAIFSATGSLSGAVLAAGLGVLGGLLMLAAVWSLGRWMHYLGQRLNEQALGQRALWLARAWVLLVITPPALHGVILLLGWMVQGGGPGSTTAGSPLGVAMITSSCLHALAQLALLFVALWGLVVLFQFRGKLLQAAHQAESWWQQQQFQRA